MPRMLKRVPLDFDYPLNKVWYGYLIRPVSCSSDESDHCEECRKFAEIKGIPLKELGCPDYSELIDVFMRQLEPPLGEGYQLWENTSEGSPQSPVFPNLNALCDWCAELKTVYAGKRITAEEWKKVLQGEVKEIQLGDLIISI